MPDKAQKDLEYRSIINNADLVLSDGIGLKIASKIFGETMVDNCNGTDLSPKILKLAADNGYSVFFLGGEDGIALKAAENAKKTTPKLDIKGTHSGYFDDDKKIVDLINATGVDILFVAMGVPLQEKWIAKYREQLNCKLALGVGAFLDYLSGSIPRAPLWMRKCHVEWFWRCFIDPKRMLKRYFVDGFCFVVYVFLYRLGFAKNKLKS